MHRLVLLSKASNALSSGMLSKSQGETEFILSRQRKRAKVTFTREQSSSLRGFNLSCHIQQS